MALHTFLSKAGRETQAEENIFSPIHRNEVSRPTLIHQIFCLAGDDNPVSSRDFGPLCSLSPIHVCIEV